MSVKVLLVDDHKILREGLRKLLEQCGDMKVVGEAENGQEAVRLFEKCAPGVIVMDVNMPDMDGIETTRRILAINPDARILALSMYSERRFIADMMKAGAAGYLMKNCPFRELVDAIHTVVDGQTYLSKEITRTVVEDYKRKLFDSDAAQLTPREKEILPLLAEGRTAKQIAVQLFLSDRTVEKHRQNIMTKLNIHSLAELIRYAYQEGIARE